MIELSPREHEVMALLIEGASNKEIGAKLRRHDGTIKAHLCHIFQKLGAKNRAHAAVLYVRSRDGAIKKHEIGGVQTQ